MPVGGTALHHLLHHIPAMRIDGDGVHNLHVWGEEAWEPCIGQQLAGSCQHSHECSNYLSCHATQVLALHETHRCQRAATHLLAVGLAQVDPRHLNQARELLHLLLVVCL